MTEDSYNQTNINILKVFPTFILGKCRCGCNEDIELRLESGYLKRFVCGHSARGENNGHWKGGIQKHGKYKLILKKDHPNVKKDGTVYLHRFIYEKYYNCCLLKFAVIDHIDGNPSNNDISNLQPLYNSSHMKKHKPKMDITGFSCSKCKTTETYIYKDSPKWCNDRNGGYMCFKCYHVELYNLKVGKPSLLSPKANN